METIIPTKTFGIFSFIKFTLLFVFIGIILIEATYNSVHEHSIAPFIKTIGDKLTHATDDLSKASKLVIEQQSLYKSTPDFWTGTWNFFKLNVLFFTSLYTLLMWIYVFMWLIARSPFSNTQMKFNNLVFAIVLFFLLQGIFILANEGISKNIDCFNKCDKSAIGFFISPITSLGNLFNAVYIVLQPLFGIAHKVEGLNG